MGIRIILTDPEILDRAAELYVASSEAQHGDVEMARHEAELWAGLLAEARMDVEEGRT